MNFYKDISCAIFDLDGTLVESISAWREVDINFMKRRNLPIPDDFYDRVSTLNFSQAADYVIAECGVTDPKEVVMNEWLEELEYDYANVIGMVAGAKEFITKLHQNGVRIALATASRPELFKPCLERHGVLELFDVFVTTDEVERKKGFPDVYLLAAEKAGVDDPTSCAVFEDIYLGCVGAKAANMYTVGVLEEHSKDDWEKMRGICDLIIEDYTSLV